MAKQRKGQRWGALHSLKSASDGAIDTRQIIGTDVGQFLSLDVSPNGLRGIQLRRISGQKKTFHTEPPALTAQIFGHEPALVRRQPVPYQSRFLPAEVPFEIPEEQDQTFRVVTARTRLKKQTAVPAVPAGPQSGSNGKRFPAESMYQDGCFPRGAQVRRTEGRLETPLSPSKKIQAFRRRALFLPPGVLRWPSTGSSQGCVPSLPGRLLQRPTHRPEQLPDMARMIMNARQPFDDRRDARQSPDIRAVSVSTRSLAQSPLNPLPLLPAQPGLPAGPSQRCGSALLPGPVPPADALAAHLQVPRNGGQDDLACRKKTCSTFSPLLQSSKIPPCPVLSMHDISTYPNFSNCHYIICEAQ